jgi:threonine dehydratase
LNSGVTHGLSDLASRVAARTRDVSRGVREHTVLTPLAEFAAASDQSGARVLVKSEHLQRTGSFKLRGALAKLGGLTEEQRERGVVAASTGNHGLGVAHALATLGGTGIVCVPPNASAVKVAAIRRYGVEIQVMGAESGETEVLARDLADRRGLCYVSPYNDIDVIAGQGTIGEEIVEQSGEQPVDAVVVAVGGGGLVSGIAATMKSLLPAVHVLGASPANDAVMAASVAAGRVVDVVASPTVSDGTAGGVESETVTLPLCSELVDEWLLVPEEQVRHTLRFVIDNLHQLVEGSAAVAIAAAMAYGTRHPGARVVAVSCGANISADTLARALTGN